MNRSELEALQLVIRPPELILSLRNKDKVPSFLRVAAVEIRIISRLYITGRWAASDDSEPYQKGRHACPSHSNVAAMCTTKCDWSQVVVVSIVKVWVPKAVVKLVRKCILGFNWREGAVYHVLSKIEELKVKLGSRLETLQSPVT